ncbi:MAG: gephyrin-like molybdotransferase Glp [Actinomycetota bacterium]|nr:molybdopterin molybdotransferase MoeA [Actinomycetota bacterium]
MARTMKRAVTSEELSAPVTPYQDALREVLSAFRPLPPVVTPLRDALGLVCAETVTADHDVPPFPSSAMDGYAIHAADTAGATAEKPAVLTLAGDIPAGTSSEEIVQRGTATKIMTGAPLPPGADAIVPWEDTQPRDGEIAVLVAVPERKHVRPQGEDVPAGTPVIPQGAMLGPVHLGVLASLGRAGVKAHPRPRVAVLSTGDELVEAGKPLGPGQIHESNAVLIAALLDRAGAAPGDVAMIGDDPDAIAAWLKKSATSHDLIVTTGGASVGEHDWMREVLTRDGELKMWRVAIKPGKPIAFGSIGGTPVFGLPGNPGSAFVGMHVFVGAAVRVLSGRDTDPAHTTMKLATGVKGSPSRTLFCRVRIEGDTAVPLPAQSSVVLSNLLPTEAFAVVPPGGLPAGAPVRVEPL